MIGKINLSQTLNIYTDGANGPTNPGPAGSGVVFMQDDKIIHTICQPIGIATNNAAELSAILFALNEIKNIPGIEKHRIRLFTDSQYCLGSIKENWNARTNISLIRKIKRLVKRFGKLTFHKVKGHSGIYGNEMADHYAVKAKRMNSMETMENK